MEDFDPMGRQVAAMADLLQNGSLLQITSVKNKIYLNFDFSSLDLIEASPKNVHLRYIHAENDNIFDFHLVLPPPEITKVVDAGNNFKPGTEHCFAVILSSC